MDQRIKDRFSTFFTNLKKVDSLRLLSVCASLTLLYFASGYCKWIELAVSLIAIVFMAFLPLQSGLCLFVFLHSFTLSNISYNSCLIFTFIGFVVVLLVRYVIGLKKGTYVLYRKIVFSLSAFFCVSMIISLFKPKYFWSWLYPLYAVLFYLIFAMRKEFKVSQVMNYLFGGILVTCSLGLFSQLLPKYQYDVLYGGDRFMGFFNNPNTLYIRALFALSYYMYRTLNNKLSIWSFGLIYLICALFSILTKSKAGLICLVLLTVAFLILFLIKDFKRNWKYVAIFIVLMGIASLVAWKFVSVAFERLFRGIGNENFLSTFLTGRDQIWKDYFEEIFKNPFNALFGKGVFTQQVFIISQNCFRETHSLYIFLLHRFGILGTVALGYIIYLFIKELNYSKPKAINFLPLIYILVVSLIANTMKCNNISYFLLAIMILFMDQKAEEIPEKKN